MNNRIDELKADIDKMRSHIKRGHEFEEQGYDCAMMNALNYVVLEKMKKELAELCPT